MYQVFNYQLEVGCFIGMKQHISGTNNTCRIFVDLIREKLINK